MARLIDIKLPTVLAKALQLPKNSPRNQQIRELKRLLKKAKDTEFGKKYKFDEILNSKHPGLRFKELVPTHDYNNIFNNWWSQTLNGTPNITWPGKYDYYALSSGTSEAASKYIPLTKEMLKSHKISMAKQYLSLLGYKNLPLNAVGKSMLMIGGTTDLQKGEAGWLAGDLSGILARTKPFWIEGIYKPGKKVAAIPDWHVKLNKIVEEAPNWDIGFVVGVPAWCQLCIEKIIEHHRLKTIHDLWPNFRFFVHGGVAFSPYKKSFEKLCSKPLVYIENYLSSEGFIGYVDRQNAKGIKLILNNWLYLEFVPFNEQNFDENGNLVNHPETLMIHEVELGKEYAILMSTNSGAWRYLIGDTVKFVDIERHEILITGRTKFFLSLVGEHLSVDNMNQAIQKACEELNISIPEYTVAGIPDGNFFSHHWYVACDNELDVEQLRSIIDNHLCAINDDYEVERKSALKNIYLEVLPEKKFLEFMALKGKLGSQHKFPRVVKGKVYEEWMHYLKTGSLP
jgi:glycosyltransferase involved in cell wall biosynthesis